MKKLLTGALAVGTLAIGSLGQVNPAEALSLTLTGSGNNNVSGKALSASALFETLAGNQLRITLTNAASTDVTNASDVLTGLFFKYGGATLTPIQALVSSGSAVYNNTTQISSAGTNLSGQWAYKQNVGTGAAGFGLFGTNDVFPPDQAPPNQGVGGVDYGLLSAGDNLATGNGSIQGRNLIKNSVTLLLQGQSAIDLGLISDVSFQYGTSLTETNIPVTPVPTPALLPSAVGMGIAALRRKKREQGLEEATQEA